MISIDKAIEYLKKPGYVDFEWEHKRDKNEIIKLLKSLATRCQDYDALLDELKDKLDNYGDIIALIRELEKKYLGDKND